METYTLLAADRRPYQSPVPGALGGHRRSKVYGRLDCPTALTAIAKGRYVQHRVFFADEDAAIAAGYRPCGSCLRLKYRQWVADHPSSPLAALAPRALRDSPHLPSGRGDLRERAGLHDQAGEAFIEAAARSSKERACGPATSGRGDPVTGLADHPTQRVNRATDRARFDAPGAESGMAAIVRIRWRRGVVRPSPQRGGKAMAVAR